MLFLVASALALLAVPCIAEDPGHDFRPMENLEQALMNLEASLNGTSFCFSRIKELWEVATERKVKLEAIRDDLFRSMNRLAQLEASSPILKECPAPFERVAGGCFFPSDEKIKFWNDARLVCGRMGGDLAYPRDLSLFRSWVRGLRDEYGYYYIGARANPKDEFPIFLWLDGRRLLKEESYRTDFLVYGDALCVGIQTYGGYELKNKDCGEYRRRYICEIKVKEE
ncbi:uncharacterized protein LOC135220167 [Macrobrachium nipponense]|uniref:uncharacterized protein LOC135220167 n=1 Tax=Macrobrachium nipponense TaxID=159736 RepID=UPI0030C7DCDB